MLRVYQVAVRMVREVMPLIEQIERRDPDLGRQLRRAVVSTPLNMAEGSDQSGKRRAQRYRIALGSARETWAGLTVAQAAGYIREPSPALRSTFREVIGTLHRCIFAKP